MVQTPHHVGKGLNHQVWVNNFMKSSGLTWLGLTDDKVLSLDDVDPLKQCYWLQYIGSKVLWAWPTLPLSLLSHVCKNLSLCICLSCTHTYFPLFLLLYSLITPPAAVCLLSLHPHLCYCLPNYLKIPFPGTSSLSNIISIPPNFNISLVQAFPFHFY